MTSFLSSRELWNWWSPIWLAVAVLTGAYVGMIRGRFTRRSGWFLAAMAALLMAFVSPIGVLADGYLFSAHMVQHLLLLLIVPLCLLLSLPGERVEVRRNDSLFGRLRRLLTVPMFGWLCGIGAMWLWHAPSLCSAATQNEALGIVRSTSFLLAGLAFWWPIYAPNAHHARLRPPSAVVYLFSACLGCTLLGVYITFTTISVCPAFANPADRIGILTTLYQAGLTPAADQQLGGLLMWVPPCSLYVCAIISILCRWYAAEDFGRIATGPGNNHSLTKATS